MSTSLERHLRHVSTALVALLASPLPFILLGHVDTSLVGRLGFAGVPRQWSQAAVILATNVHHLWLPLLMSAVLVQAGWQLATDIGRRRFTRLWDCGVFVLVAFVWALPVGVTVGAHGTRMLRAMLPAGPVEMSAYALAMSVYLQSRSDQIIYLHDGALRVRRSPALAAAAIALLSGLLLVSAALLETFA